MFGFDPRKGGAMFLGAVVAAAVATTTTTPTQCPMQKTSQQAAVEAALVYTTVMGDNPWSLARRFYGDGKKCYLFYNPKVQPLTKEGFFPVGTKLVMPPDESGRMPETYRPDWRQW